MATPDLETYTVWRKIGQHAGQSVIEAAPVSEPGARVNIWPGPLPDLPMATHPLVAMPIGLVQLDGQPGWLEQRPAGVLLSDLAGDLTAVDTALIIAQVADALGALHARGLAHGQLAPNRVVISMNGTPVLIGAGVTAGTDSEDLKAALGLLQCSSTPLLPPAASSAAALAASLRELASPVVPLSSTLREQIECAMLPPLPSQQRIELEVASLTHHDEVQPDLGPDERIRGLLDPWSSTGSSGELSEDHTETISASELAEQGQQAMLERLSELYARADLSGRFEQNEGTPCEATRALLSTEPLDPIPPVDGVQSQTDAIPEAESTVEVTQEAPNHGPSSVPIPRETTGWRGAEATVPRPSRTRARRTALIAVLACALTLGLTATYLSCAGP
jgi:hypothetical protein